MRVLSLVVVVAAALALLPGCPLRSVGACTYGSSGGEEGTVEIVSIAMPEQPGPYAQVSVEVRGLFSGTIGIPLADFPTCFEARGYGVGSVVGAKIVYGGACPPEEMLTDCPF
jgi:hypothetical protein